ncbi:MAG: hypothetical protein P4L46_09400 [Fimbriimonas sp.]|nr:hypothetical protein [Fimbriimonas sp.]
MGASRAGIILPLLLCAANAFGQVVSDPAKVTGLQQPVDIHLKRALLPELIGALHKQTGLKFSMSGELEPLMVCVFVEKYPLGKVMHAVADVLGCEWHDLRSEWRLVESPKAKAMLATYTLAEQVTLERDGRERANALADYVRSHSFQPQSVEALAAPEPDSETPAQWVDRVVADEAYYVAGIMFRDTPPLVRRGNTTAAPMHVYASEFGGGGWPCAYRLIAPANEAIDGWLDCGPAGNLAANLGDAQAVIRFLPWVGSIQAVLVDSAAHRAKKPKHLIRYPKPVGSLVKNVGARWIVGWESNLSDVKEPGLDLPVNSLDLQPSGFDQGQRGIEDYLEALFDRTKQPILSDGFRIPTLGVPPPNDAPSIRSWLAQTRESQKCFVKVDDGCVMIRHGGYWDLRAYEPDEKRLRAFEKITRPDLNDYADYVVAAGEDPTGVVFYQMFPIFDTQEVPLTRFDSKPLREYLYPLLAYGQMSPASRMAVLAGGSFDTVTHHYATERFSALVKGTTAKGRPGAARETVWSGTREVGAEVQDMYLTTSASLGIFYGGVPVGREREMLEAYAFPSNYLSLWNRCPDQAPDFVAKFGLTVESHAHYLFLRSGANVPPAGAAMPSKTLYGRFEFLAGISDHDGVINVIDIPFPK